MEKLKPLKNRKSMKAQKLTRVAARAKLSQKQAKQSNPIKAKRSLSIQEQGSVKVGELKTVAPRQESSEVDISVAEAMNKRDVTLIEGKCAENAAKRLRTNERGEAAERTESDDEPTFAEKIQTGKSGKEKTESPPKESSRTKCKQHRTLGQS